MALVLFLDCRALLRFWREESQRRSSEVIEIWESLLCEDANLSALGDERWMIVEQVAVAAMDVHRLEILDHCLKQLRTEFDTDSFRVRRLYAMRCEMVEDYENALEFYDSILADDDANSQARKRKIAIYKAQKDSARAIQELNRYLKE